MRLQQQLQMRNQCRLQRFWFGDFKLQIEPRKFTRKPCQIVGLRIEANTACLFGELADAGGNGAPHFRVFVVKVHDDGVGALHSGDRFAQVLQHIK